MTTAPTKILRKIVKGTLLLFGAALGGLLAIALTVFTVSKISDLVNPDPRLKIHTDVAELKNMLDLDIPIAAVKWQIFSSPEDDGILWPAQDAQSILIAEIDLADASWFNTRAPLPGTRSIALESARPWLSEPFKILVGDAAKNKNRLANDQPCGLYEASIKKSGRIVDGYICKIAGKILLYLPVHTPS